jgi:hypothetical protein
MAVPLVRVFGVGRMGLLGEAVSTALAEVAAGGPACGSAGGVIWILTKLVAALRRFCRRWWCWADEAGTSVVGGIGKSQKRFTSS